LRFDQHPSQAVEQVAECRHGNRLAIGRPPQGSAWRSQKTPFAAAAEIRYAICNAARYVLGNTVASEDLS
jgi:hypothetical protein